MFSDLMKKMRLLEAANVTQASHLTPKALKFYSVAKKIRNIGRKIRSERNSLAERLKATETSLRSNDHLYNQVNNATWNFLLMQLQQNKARRRRRYSIEEKLLSLSVMKQGPRAYCLLEKLFTLPSRKTLMNLLNHLPFKVGVNENILASLKNSVGKMNP